LKEGGRTAEASLEGPAAWNKGLVLNVLSVTLMSLSPVLNKFSLERLSSAQAAFFSSLFTILFSYANLRLRGHRLVFVRNRVLWLVGLLNAAGVICLFTSLELLSPVMVGFIGRFYIVFAILFSVFYLKEAPSRPQVLCIGAAIAGTFLFVGKELDISSLMGVATALLYTFFFAWTNVLVKVSVKNLDTSLIHFYSNSISSIFVLGYLLARGEVLLLRFDKVGLGLVCLSALLGNFLGLLLFFEGLKHIEFSKANLIRAMSPVLVAAFSWPFFPVEMSPMNLSGALLLLASVIGLTLYEGRRSAPR
jgi:drug/metabolite transporter (DMT)-like permease